MSLANLSLTYWAKRDYVKAASYLTDARVFNKLCQVKNGFYKNTDYGKREAKIRF